MESCSVGYTITVFILISVSSFLTLTDGDDCEVIELVPHIIENPAYQFSRHFDPMQESFLSPSVSSHSAVALV